jgi:hypothetical protein
MAEFEMSERKPLEITDEVDLWRQYQAELAKGGISYEAQRLDSLIWKSLGVVPGTGSELPEERLHRLAYPDASTRPPRLTLWEEYPDCRETIL